MKKLILSIFLLCIGLLGCSDKISFEPQVFAQSGYWPGGMRAGYVTQTTGVLHLYADGTSGSDSNNGLTALTAKKTLSAVFSLLPSVIKHNTAIHLNGTFTISSDTTSNLIIPLMASNINFIVDGGPIMVTVADNSGSPWSADINSTTSIGLSTAGWVADVYKGYIVEVLSGPASGQHRTIQSNTATTITPHRNFTVDPGAGATFRISRYATTINATEGKYQVIIVNYTGYGRLTFERMSFLGSGYLLAYGPISSNSQFRVNHFLTTAYYSGNSIACTNCNYFGTSDGYYDSNTFSYINSATGPLIGTSSLSASGGIKITATANYNLNSLITSHSVIIANSFGYVSNGSRIYNLNYQCSLAAGPSVSTYEISNTANYANTKLGGGTNGITMDNSYVRIASGDISNCSSHAISMAHSELIFQGAVTGTTNTGAGVYAHSGSVIHIKHGSPPTLTGTVGNLSIDGTTEATSWTTLDAGVPYVSAMEMTMAKEVP